MNEANDSSIRRVAVIGPGEQAGCGAVECKVGTTIELDPLKLVTYCSGEWNPIIFDAFVLCGAVEFCDRRFERPRGWGRHFAVSVPVHEPARWSNQRVSETLSDALAKLTGDRWDISFTQRKFKDPEIGQTHLHWPKPNSIILPFSDGMDSRAVATLFRGPELVLVRLGIKQIDHPNIEGRRQAFTTVPYAVPGRHYPETSCRSRGFKFAMVGALAAYLSGSNRVVVPESGQGMLGPVFCSHGPPDYRTHPAFLTKMQAFLHALLEVGIVFEFPRLWSTKGETLRAAIDAVATIPWRETRSCWQPNTQMSVGGRKRQCGFCAACMLRRLSVNAAGQTEVGTKYMLEDLSARSLEEGLADGYDQEKFLGEAQQSYAVAGVAHLDQLANLFDSPRSRPGLQMQLRELARALGQSDETVEAKVRDLIGRHRAEWSAFLRSLSPHSFIRQRSMGVA